jgi:hypothetical protein
MSNETGKESQTYGVAMVCLNCGCERTIYFKKGKEVPRKEICPNCSVCQMVKKMYSPRNQLVECMDVFFNGRPMRP